MMDKGQGYTMVGFKEYAVVQINSRPEVKEISWSQRWYKEDEESLRDFTVAVHDATRMTIDDAISALFKLKSIYKAHQLKVVRFNVDITDVEIKVIDEKRHDDENR